MDYIFVVGDQVMVSPGTRFYAVTLMDQFMDRHSVRENRLKLLASACLMIAGTHANVFFWHGSFSSYFFKNIEFFSHV